jgi:hypothetical protein
MKDRLTAIRAEFERNGCELVLQPSTRGEMRGGWLARYHCPGQHVVDVVAHGNTALEAAELALARFRTYRAIR